MHRAPSPELRTPYKEQPIPGWQPFETDPIVRRVDSHGTEYNVPWYDVIGRGQRYLNPHDPSFQTLKGKHPTYIIISEMEEPREPDFQRVPMEGGAKSIMDVLAAGYSQYDDDYRRYILEKADMEAHRFLLKNCAYVENSVLACIAEEGVCGDVYAELLTCGAVRLFPEITAALANLPLEDTKTEEYVQRKNELIRNTVSAFLRRDKYYTTKQMDFYRRRVAHCAQLEHLEQYTQESYQVEGQDRPQGWMDDQTEDYSDYYDEGLTFAPPERFAGLGRGEGDTGDSADDDEDDDEGDPEEPDGVDLLDHSDEVPTRKGSYADDWLEYEERSRSLVFPPMDGSDDENDLDLRDEELDLAMAKCVIPGICPKPLDEWVHCITAAEGIEAHCVRPYKRLLSCLYNFQFYAFGDDDPYAADSEMDSIDEDTEGSEYEDEAEEEQRFSEPNGNTDLGPHTGLFRSGLYRAFHTDPNTLPLDELEEDHVIMKRQIARLEHRRRVENGLDKV